MIDGALLLDKPLGLSSNAALQAAKRLFGAAKAGHAGTLDPLASGLLLVLFGEATKFAGPLLDADKEYLATLKLGERTATGDAEGEVDTITVLDETRVVMGVECVVVRLLDPASAEDEVGLGDRLVDQRGCGEEVALHRDKLVVVISGPAQRCGQPHHRTPRRALRQAGFR